MAANNCYQRRVDSIMELTPREKQVFYMLLEGMKAKEIALNASISVSGANYFIKKIWTYVNIVDTKTRIFYADFIALSSHC